MMALLIIAVLFGAFLIGVALDNVADAIRERK